MKILMMTGEGLIAFSSFLIMPEARKKSKPNLDEKLEVCDLNAVKLI